MLTIGPYAIVVDRFSSRLFLYAISKHCTAPEMAQLFVDEICYKAGRGVPLSVISDNDKLFTANFFKALFERFGTKWHFSTARTQSTDGKAERYIAVVEEILRTRINYKLPLPSYPPSSLRCTVPEAGPVPFAAFCVLAPCAWPPPTGCA